jgi:hypothetical protein
MLPLAICPGLGVKDFISEQMRLNFWNVIHGMLNYCCFFKERWLKQLEIVNIKHIMDVELCRKVYLIHIKNYVGSIYEWMQ